MTTTRSAALGAALFLGAALTAAAGTNGFVVPTFRGDPGSSFVGWESFTVGVGGAGNAGDMAGSASSARLFQSSPNALVLGSGNIYDGTEASQFEIRYSGIEPVGQVVLQVRSLGTELKYDDVRLVAWTQSLGSSRTELDRVSFGPPPPSPGSGVGVSSLWQWDIAALNANSFAIAFGANEVNLSLDSATLDVRAVPEPGVAVLGVLGAVLLGWRRLRR